MTPENGLGNLLRMLDGRAVDKEVIGYRLKLVALSNRYLDGERSTVATEAQTCADELTCLMEEAPLKKRLKIDYLIDRYEALRTSCSS